MTAFVKLSGWYDQFYQEPAPVFVNPDHVTYLQDANARHHHTTLVLVGGTRIDIAESPEQIVALMGSWMAVDPREDKVSAEHERDAWFAKHADAAAALDADHLFELLRDFLKWRAARIATPLAEG